VVKKVQLNRLRLMARASERREQSNLNDGCAECGGQEGSFRVVRAVLRKQVTD
jgi:hypothetical protein